MQMGATTAAVASSVVDVEIPHLIRTYKCGRIRRLNPSKFVPPAVDPRTGVASEDVVVNPVTGLSARLYRPPAAVLSTRQLPLLVYFHGGGFCSGSPFNSIYHYYLNSLVAEAGLQAVSVDYRLAPESSLPAAYEDSWEALCWAIGSRPEREVFLAGDSAGANIAHQMGVRLGREGREVEGMALVHPFFWGRETMGREAEERKGVLFKAEDAPELWQLVCPSAVNGLDNPWLNPLVEGGPGLAGLGCRRLIVCVAGMDLLWDRGRAYYEKLVDSGWGGEAEFFESDGVDHGFHLVQRRSVQAANLMRRLVDFFDSPGRKNGAWGVLSVNGITCESNPTSGMRAKL